MELYNPPEQGPGDVYMIQGVESDPRFAGLLPEQLQAMYSERAPEFVVDQSMYYPPATNYGYLYPGYESPGEWDDLHRIFGLENQDLQYTGVQTDSLPYVYYTPSYGYTQSPYNPYNPYIPGAMINVDGSFVGAQDYYTVPSYDGGVSSSAYFPTVVPSTSDIVANSSTGPFVDSSAPTAKRSDGSGLKHNTSLTSTPSYPASVRPVSSHTKPFTRAPEGNRTSLRVTKQPIIHSGVTSTRFSKAASSQTLQGRSAQPMDNVLPGKEFSSRNQFRVTPSASDGSSSFGSSVSSWAMVDKTHPQFIYGKVNEKNIRASPDVLAQSPGLRANKSKNHLVVKAYTTRAGDVDEQGYITIDTKQYNREDFQVDFPNAKFFVIKSYSEDDVHKSIKYNVWSSTPNGNKKLQAAYEDTQRIAAADPRGCPIFLFFSVNASGQFCGVAEMIGPVDFHKNMDFWQQDKWTGSFPVKWHIIKDVPNPNFRHVILENNENKPVTNSRDTQEIFYKKGIEMLKICKEYTSRTSLLDDFMYYENRQKILQEEKARLLIKNYGSSFIVPVLDPPRKLHSILDLSSSEDEKISKPVGSDSSTNNVIAPAEQVSSGVDANVDEETSKLEEAIRGEPSDVDELKIGSLTISSPKQSQTEISEVPAPAVTTPADPAASTAASVNVVAVGSMPVKVNGYTESSGFLTVGTIPLDPRALQHDEASLAGKNAPKKA